MVNYYDKIKKGMIIGGISALASLPLFSSNVSANEIEERMISQAIDNSTIQTSFEYGKNEMGDSEKESLKAELKAIPLKIYKTNDDNKTLYFDLGIGGSYNLNKDSGVFTFGLPYDKKDQDLKLLFDSNFLSSNDKGIGFKANLNGGINLFGSLEDSLSSQGADKKGFNIGASGEILKTMYYKGNFTTLSIGGEYNHSQENFSKDPEGRDQALDTSYNEITIPLKMMHYNSLSNSISTIETFLNIDLNNGKIGGGFGLETMFKNFGIGVDVENSSKGTELDFGIKGKIGDFSIEAGVKNLMDQKNPNLWNADITGYVGIDYNIKFNNNKKKIVEIEPTVEPLPKLNDPILEKTTPVIESVDNLPESNLVEKDLESIVN